MALICFKNTLEEKKDFQSIDNDLLTPAIITYARNNAELYDLIMKQKVSILVNNEVVPVDEWPTTMLEDSDEVVISPAIGDTETMGYVQMGVGVVLMIYGGVTGNPALFLAGASMFLGGVSAYLFQPDVPSLPTLSDSSSSQTYNWNGISTAARTDIPVPVIYGIHRVGGNVISLFKEASDDQFEYLYVLLALGEGEIEGVCSYNASNPTNENVLTSNYVHSGSARAPDILVDGQPIILYSDWEAWIRTGTNPQNAIPHFDDSRVLYQSGDKIPVSPGVVYSTTTEVDYVDIVTSSPALYTVGSDGNIEDYTIEYTIEFKYTASSVNTYKTLGVDTPYSWSAVVSSGWVEFISFSDGSPLYYGPDAPPTRKIKIISNNFVNGAPMPSIGYWSIWIQILDASNSVLETRELRYKLKYSTSRGMTSIPDVTIETIGVYKVKVGYGISAGAVVTLSSTASGLSSTFKLTSKSKDKVTRQCPIDFKSLGMAKAEYDLRFTRVDGGESDSFRTENALELESVTEVILGEFTYPNTALLGLKLKATGQLSGSPPTITTRVKGKKIQVPDLSMTATDFDECYWDGSDWKTRDGDYTQTWDGSTWKTEHSHNAMLCVRDSIISGRYGLGEYLNATDLDTSNVNTAIKECHQLYTPSNSHYHQYDGVLESEQSALAAIMEMCHAFRSWPVWVGGNLDFVLDRDDTPIHTIAKSNTMEFEQSFTPVSEIPYAAKAQFTNKEADYDMRSVIARSNDTSLIKLNESTIGLKGITDFKRAVRELKFRLNKAINCTHLVNFKCGLDMIHASAGDIVYIQDDLPQWGYGGRVISYDTATASVLLDASVLITATSLEHTFRFMSEGGEYQTATLDLSGKSNSSYRTFPLVSHVATPAEDAVFTIGKTGGEPKKFRILNISRKESDVVEVSAVEHLSTLYTNPPVFTVDDDVSDLPNPFNIPGYPVIHTIEPYDYGIGIHIKAIPEPTSEGVKEIIVQISEDNANFSEIGRLTPPTWSMIYQSQSLNLNTTYYIKLFCVTATKQGQAVTSEIVLPAADYTLNPPTGIHIKGQSYNTMTFNGKDVAIAWNPIGVTSANNSFVDGYIVDVHHLSSLSEVPSTANKVNYYNVKSEEFLYTFEENERNSTGSPSSIISFIIKTKAINGGESDPSTPFTVSNTSPTLGIISSKPYQEQAQFWWAPFSYTDLNYYTYRYKIESGGSWSSWEETTTPVVTLGLTNTQKSNGDDQVFIEVKTVDLFEQESSVASTNQLVDAMYVAYTDIGDFEQNISSDFFYIPVLDADTWTNNSPSAGYIAWNEHTVWFQGTEYTISAGNTNKKYVYWESLGSSYSTSDTNPASGLTNDQDFIIGTNISGVFKRAWGSIANQAIGTAYIQDAAIGDAQIDELSASLLKAGSIMTDGIVAGGFTITGDTIENDELVLDATNKKITLNSTTFGTSGIQLDYNSGDPRFFVGNATDFARYESGSLSLTASVTADRGQIGGFNVDSGTVKVGNDIVLDSANKRISIKSATFGNDGIQLDYNGGTPRFYTGNGTNRFVKYDGTNLSWRGVDTELTTTGTLAVNNLQANGGTIAGWVINSTSLKSAESAERIELDTQYNRIRVFDAVNEKVAMGYLEGLEKNASPSQSWGSNDYGFWAKPGDHLVVDGNASYISGDWVIYNDASYKVLDGSNNEILRLGTDTGEKGLFLYTTVGTTLAKFVTDEVAIGDYAGAEHGLVYDQTTGQLSIRGSLIITGGSGYDQLTDTPTSLSDINSAEGSKLDSVATGADVTADNETFSQESDINVLLTTNAPAAAGADVTADNTAANTASVDSVDAANIAGWAYSSDTTYIDGGTIYTDTVNASQINVNTLSALSANMGTLTSGIIQSTDLNATAGVQLHLTNRTLKMGGTDVVASSPEPGIFLGLDSSNYKFYVGDGSNSYMKFDGDSVDISFDSGDNLTLKSGAGIYIEEGGDITLEAGSTAGKIIYQGAQYDTEMFQDNLVAFRIRPVDDQEVDLYIGESAQAFRTSTIYTKDNEDPGSAGIILTSKNTYTADKYAHVKCTPYGLFTTVSMEAEYSTTYHSKVFLRADSGDSYFEVYTGNEVLGLKVDKNQKVYVSSSGAIEYNQSSPSGTTVLGYNGYLYATRVYNAVYNDIADFQLINDEHKPGYCYRDTQDGLVICNERCQLGVVGVYSDTYGYGLGSQDGQDLAPIAVAGWVLAYVDKIYKSGTPLTNNLNGVLTEMTIEEKSKYPERIVATYKKKEEAIMWGSKDDLVTVDGRHWVKVI